jgi:hypothetical protein
MPGIFSSSRWLALAAIAALAIGCKKNTPDPETAGAAPAMAHTGPPLTEADCEEFGQKLEKAVADGDRAAVKQLLRLNDLFERSISDFGLTAKEKSGILTGAANGGDRFADLIIVIQL